MKKVGNTVIGGLGGALLPTDYIGMDNFSTSKFYTECAPMICALSYPKSYIYSEIGTKISYIITLNRKNPIKTIFRMKLIN
jgi:hypothetical protein